MFAYCNNNPVIYADPDGNRLMMAYAGGGSKWVDLIGPWRYRIDAANTNTNTKRHVHVQNTRTKKEYMQNDDGSSHDKGNGEGGKLPNKVQKALMEREGWDYNGNRERFIKKTTITVRDDGVVYVYADGTRVLAPCSVRFANTSTVESYYLNCKAHEIDHFTIGLPLIEMLWPVPIPVWGTMPVVPAF